ncbi:MAG: hypothetical protein A2821_00050 [Candidatus Magasanikbacteria bacterium RIFCSPHIGHO2_01_FULL_41_23]|uniref:Uncharacterized protein n=1 Tax=Candidatus Magasanikbacteria bacterium RIFCSPLOWO2_01_FULL_40_15 TaxID=1798686 RepID=A0A1F6N3U0_9BACT|nr:MAG: hypothetical protein A2821_00050 [Candidatus Magasanikbacteria bacterium RIFCSPHIGHO2_01_FULL_41_23]OGH76611.1 MAG: hypothetical protein A3F22_04720 [Candidatus Magasanikbacteria bacterium RIFCSPHIGHO2_12_FULL_41_16]OGH78589.1 MAG: hypothetical protein A2983_02920 [Candidatus Magasanikbacteria bacterium RIFCSPLOWO2_01_FULL_40_15]
MQNFSEVKEKAETLYKTLEAVDCPYFKSKVFFNSEELQHLKFKSRAKARLQHDQYMRFKLLHFAPVVLKNSGTLQGRCEAKSFERVRVHSRTDTILKDVTYYEFIAVIEDVRLKIIVKEIENGQKFFWSIIPHWGINNNHVRKLHYGHPAED